MRGLAGKMEFIKYAAAIYAGSEIMAHALSFLGQVNPLERLLETTIIGAIGGTVVLTAPLGVMYVRQRLAQKARQQSGASR